MDNLASAALQLIKELKGVKENLILCYRATLYDVGAILVFYTPIDTGFASSNWNVGTGGHTSVEREPIDGVKGLAALQAISDQVKTLQVGITATFSNPVDYIIDLENGKSRQARAGMITPTMSRVNDVWLNNAKHFNLIS